MDAVWIGLGAVGFFWIFLDMATTISMTYTKADQSDLLFSSFHRKAFTKMLRGPHGDFGSPAATVHNMFSRRLSVKEPEGQRLSELVGMVKKQRESYAWRACGRIY